jgi:hypothetical protein
VARLGGWVARGVRGLGGKVRGIGGKVRGIGRAKLGG